MKCPRCAEETATKAEFCPHCSYIYAGKDDTSKPEDDSQAGSDWSWFSRHPLVLTVQLLALAVLVVGTGINLALMQDPGLGMIFWMIWPVFVWLAVSWALVALPLWWPVSTLFAWWMERSRVKPLPLWRIFVVNVWTVLAAVIGWALLQINTYTHGRYDVIGHLTNDLAGDADVVQGILIAGCLVAPVFWSGAITVAAIKKQRYAGLALVMGVLVVFLNCYVILIYSGHKLAQNRAQADAQFGDKIAARANAEAAQREAEQKAQQAVAEAAAQKLQQDTLAKMLQISPTLYSVDESQGKYQFSGAFEYDSVVYGQPAVEIKASFQSAGHQSYLTIRETKTTGTDPFHQAQGDGVCYPVVPGVTLPQKGNQYCIYDRTTPKGMRVYHGSTYGDNSYTAAHYFVRNGVFVELWITTNVPENSNTGAEVPVSTVIDSLVPVNVHSLKVTVVKPQ